MTLRGLRVGSVSVDVVTRAVTGPAAAAAAQGRAVGEAQADDRHAEDGAEGRR